jgi:hypothetical protein
MERKNYIECFICMEAAKTPVTSGCGHIFCWKCINQWLSDKETHTCPICKNGIDLNKMIRLYDGNDTTDSTDGTTGQPKNERTPPVVNRNTPSFMERLFSSFGVYGRNTAPVMTLPSDNDVRINQLALLVFMVGILLVVSMLIEW